VSIDSSGKWWRGATFDDIAEYVHEYTADGYSADQIRESICATCGSKVFGLRGDQDEGAVRRTCRDCGRKAFIADSEESWPHASVRTCRCPCGGLDYNVAIGFALRDSGEVRWVTVALRCTACGILGSFADWGIDYTPSTQLLDRC
jgi:DNA-directed RNA polymerase subunit RPC12/RpoP